MQMRIALISTKLFIIAVNFKTLVCYNHEVYLIKHAKPNQATRFARYNRVLVTVIVRTELDCI